VGDDSYTFKLDDCNGKYRYDPVAAERPIKFIEQNLILYEDKYENLPFKLMDWQKRATREIFGWVHVDTGLRRIREVFCNIGKGAGKSPWICGLAIYMFVASGEASPQIYSIGRNYQQANVTFENAKRFIEASPKLRRCLTVKQYEIRCPQNKGFWKIISGDGKGKAGLRPSCVLADEIMEWAGPETYENLQANMFKRSQPLFICATNAGEDKESLCWRLQEAATKVLKGDSEDETLYPILYSANDKDDISDPKVWHKAIPSLGHTITEDSLRTEYIKAQSSPPLMNRFKRLYMGQWCGSASRWLDMTVYDRNVQPIRYEDLRGKYPCIVAVDLSQTYDLTAVVLIFLTPTGWQVIPRLYCPADTAAQRTREDKIPYTLWIQSGAVIGTPGVTQDYKVIENEIRDICRENNVLEVAYDSYNATAMMLALEDSGITTVKIDQSFLGLSEASKQFEMRLANETIILADNPCFRWMASNVEVKADFSGNIKPMKPKGGGAAGYKGTAKSKVDGITALVSGIARAMLHNTNEGGENGNIVVFV
jgi:phage terminase large subunit-like protein